MTMDKSLRVRKGSSNVRGVLTRGERISKLKEQERWAEGRSPLGLPKVRVQKAAMKKKKKAKEEGEAGAAKPAAGAAKPAAGAAKKK
jgi:small basic protein (TIGR04137 family)